MLFIRYSQILSKVGLKKPIRIRKLCIDAWRSGKRCKPRMNAERVTLSVTVMNDKVFVDCSCYRYDLCVTKNLIFGHISVVKVKGQSRNRLLCFPPMVWSTVSIKRSVFTMCNEFFWRKSH